MIVKSLKLPQAKLEKNPGISYDSKKYMALNGFALTADIVLLSIKDNELAVLLIKRKEWPFNGSWALPGGFMDGDKDLDLLETARRELLEETNIDNIYLEQLATFSTKGRDPREGVANSPVRVISTAHIALIDYKKVTAVAGSDAEDAKWFKLSEIPPLAFDHNLIIESAVHRVRNKINYSNVGFELVPKTFTIPELREVFEHVLGRKLNATNFRTKILKLKVLKALGKKRIEGKGQPAPLYKLDTKGLETLMKEGETLFN
mgnify:CR=1 FL=1